MKMAHIAEYKKQEVKKLSDLIRKYNVIGIVNIENMPASKLQVIRALIRDKVVFIVSKKRLMKLAIEQCKNDKKGIEELKEFLLGMPAFMFTNEDPFKLSRILEKNKSNAPAKPGQVAPKDIIVNKGPTSFTPGPIIGELSSLGIKAGVENGKIVIKEDCVVCKKGDKISADLASMLSRLGIEPMEIGLKLVAAYENGIIYKEDVLAISEEEFNKKLNKAIRDAFALSIEIEYITKENIDHFLSKAQQESLALKEEIKYEDKQQETKEEKTEEQKQEKEGEKVEQEKQENKIEKSEGQENKNDESKKQDEEIKQEEKPQEEKQEEGKKGSQEVKEEIKEKSEEMEKNKDESTEEKVKEMVKKTEEFSQGKVKSAEELVSEASKKSAEEAKEKKDEIEKIAQDILSGKIIKKDNVPSINELKEKKEKGG